MNLLVVLTSQLLQIIQGQQSNPIRRDILAELNLTVLKIKLSQLRQVVAFELLLHQKVVYPFYGRSKRLQDVQIIYFKLFFYWLLFVQHREPVFG
jgi:hypothetical protein